MASVGKAISQARLAFDQHLVAWALALQGRLFCEIGALREGLSDWVAGLERIEALPDSDRRWNLRERAVYRRTDPGLLSGYLTLAGRFSDARQWISRRPFFSLRMNYEGLDSDTEFESWCLASIAAFEGNPELAHTYFRASHARAEYSGPIDAEFLLNFELWCVVYPFMLDDPHALERLAGTDIGTSEPPACIQLMRLMNDGDWSQALNFAQHMLEDASPFQHLMIQTLITTIARECGNVDLAWRTIRAVWPVGPEQLSVDQPILLTLPLLLLGASVALDQLGPASAKPWLDAHETWVTRIGAKLGLSDGHRVRARYELMLGHQRNAEEFAQLSLDEAASPRQPVSLLRAHRLRGELAALDGDTVLANDHLSASLALAESCGLKYEYSLGLLALANLRLSNSDSNAAEQYLSQAASLLKPYGMTRAAIRLHDLLAKLGSSNSGAPANVAGLTDRELEVLRLLASGLTNPEIADRLFISRFTVKRHVSAIFSKLNVSTRAAAAHYAVEHHLA
jgi:DNA-binding CsgD family transcriptional regulator